MERTLGLLCIFCIILASPAFAATCATLQPEQFASIDWGTAEHYDSYDARRLLAAMQAMDAHLIDLDAVPVPPLDALYALPEGNAVLIIRVRGNLLCADDPVDRATFEDAKRWVLPGAA